MTNIDEAIAMYTSGSRMSEIEQKTKISRYTVYRELKRRGQPLRGKTSTKLHISIDEDVRKILEREHPTNVSRWFCEKVKKATGCKG
ncbi:MAG: hypothetical protein LKE54_07305 [Prevotella sp.]|jgi:predicted DNA-binding protein YlxM (UPF0122 family)|nr:hypothetical protein [Prevotella sp.]MCH3994840.1 hypothetical protein [Prevotella sp.]